MIKFLNHIDDRTLRKAKTREDLFFILRERPLKKHSILRLSRKLGLPQREVAELLGVSLRTFQRQKPTAVTTQAASENMVKLAELYEAGLTAFDQDERSLHTWLKSPIPGLKNQIPIQLLTSSMGIDLVRDELLRIEYGIY